MEAILVKVFATALALSLVTTNPDAVKTHFDPVALKVTPAQPVTTDFGATVAWSSGVLPQVKADISKETLIGRGSGETLQMSFQGDGYVIIQPYEIPR